MEERGNKTIMCSVLFLDIVEYSKKSVTGQISLKDRFNNYLSGAICDVPMTDRIILDTGDGAAINFLGDVEDALKAALSLRESLLNERPDVGHPLLVRMGINLGPVCLVRDINGQPNIVGDGINVAQRVMGFADPAQILVSRSYYDAVSRLSPQYAGMFHYQGSRTDKHVREHEVYAIGYPGDKTTHGGKPVIRQQTGKFPAITEFSKKALNSAAVRADALISFVTVHFSQAGYRQRALYIAIIAFPLVLLIALLAGRARQGTVPIALPNTGEQAVKASPAGLASPSESSAGVKTSPPGKASNQAAAVTHAQGNKSTVKRSTPNKIAEDKPNPPHPESQEKKVSKHEAENKAAADTSGDAYISVACIEGTEVFVDGIRKGRVDSSPLTIMLTPGKHTVIISHTSRGIFTQNVDLNAGKTAHLKAGFCN